VCRKRFLYLILAFMVVLNVGLLFVAWQKISARQVRGNPAGAAVTGEAKSALAAYLYAEPVAQNWAADAHLLRARGDWPGGSFAAELENWSFVFYSEAHGAIAQINVRAGAAELISSGSANEELAPAPVTSWQVDSDAIVTSFLGGAGGELFLDERSSVSMVLSLNLAEMATWTATLIDWETGELLRRDFDAGNGYLTAGL
jgi:hypothetical protein